jgi:O-acetyl-ADP-ribose deacetylase (regulator of RNase III)
MQTVRRDILTVEAGVIVHQVNSLGVMGAGLALQIRNRYASAYRDYRAHTPALGEVLFSPVSPDLDIAHLCAQSSIGRGRRRTDYRALRKGLKNVDLFAAELGRLVYVPYRLGCGLAGGDWRVVREIIAETIPDAIVCRR